MRIGGMRGEVVERRRNGLAYPWRKCSSDSENRAYVHTWFVLLISTPPSHAYNRGGTDRTLELVANELG